MVDPHSAGVVLKVTFTPRYPKEAPTLEVRALRNINKDACADLLTRLEQEVLRFLHNLQSTEQLTLMSSYQAQQNLDMAMVLTLAQSAKVCSRSTVKSFA